MLNCSSFKLQQIFDLGNPKDFITNLSYFPQLNILTLIHQLNKVSLLNTEQNKQADLGFESNVYDTLVLGKALVVSNKNMPVRVYSIPESLDQDIPHIASIVDKKQNSEQFLTPLQLTQHGDRLVGGGKKFLSEYDLQRYKAMRVKSMDKKYISAVELLDANTLMTGSFTGQLKLLDLRAQEILSSTKPHVDLVTRVKTVHGTPMFVSVGRKDNYSYLWDQRKLNSFVNLYTHSRYENQRTGLEVARDGKSLFFGGQTGDLSICSILGAQSKEISLGDKRCVNSICQIKDSIVCSIGQRAFPLEEFQSHSSGSVIKVSTVLENDSVQQIN